MRIFHSRKKPPLASTTYPTKMHAPIPHLLVKHSVVLRTSASQRRKRPSGRNVNGKAKPGKMAKSLIRRNSSPPVMPKSKSSRMRRKSTNDVGSSFPQPRLARRNWRRLSKLDRRVNQPGLWSVRTVKGIRPVGDCLAIMRVSIAHGWLGHLEQRHNVSCYCSLSLYQNSK